MPSKPTWWEFISRTFVGIFILSATAYGEDHPPSELLLPTGALYSLANRSYRSLNLPAGWTVTAGAYSPDNDLLALVLVGSALRPRALQTTSPQDGPVIRNVRAWQASARFCILDRRTGELTQTWRLPTPATEINWSVVWASGSLVSAIVRSARGTSRVFRFDSVRHIALNPAPSEVADAFSDPDACPQTLATTTFKGKTDRFIVERAHCSTPPETSDFYRIVRENERIHRDAILWEYRVSADTTTCSAAYACYSGSSAQFLKTAEKLFLVWDGDVYALSETDDGMAAELVTQLLPQYGRPWGIAEGETQLSVLDLAHKVTFQPVTPELLIPRAESPMLYAQNFCTARGFRATVQVGSYKKNLMVPAGYQVGPAAVGDFKDRAYTPLLITATWTSFHHLTDPVTCAEPYTILPTTKGLVASLIETGQGKLQCHIDFQEAE